MRVDPKEYPLLLAKNTVIKDNLKTSIKAMEIAFESVGSPAMYMASSATLSAFSIGKSTSLVVDVGAGGITITPVIDGYALRKSSIFTNRGIHTKVLLIGHTFMRLFMIKGVIV